MNEKDKQYSIPGCFQDFEEIKNQEQNFILQFDQSSDGCCYAAICKVFNNIKEKKLLYDFSTFD